MNDYVFTTSAQQDIFDLWEFIAKDDIDAADRVRDSLYDAVGNLVTFPGMGSTRGLTSVLLCGFGRFSAI